MEEQRQRQEEEARRATAASGDDTPTPQAPIADSEEAMLQQALSMSTPQTPVFDFSAMTEEQQIEYAMRLSLQNMEAESGADGEKDVEKDKDEKQEQAGASAMETDTQVWVLFLLFFFIERCSSFRVSYYRKLTLHEMNANFKTNSREFKLGRGLNLSRDEVVSAQLFLLELAKIAKNIRKKKEPNYCLKN